MIVFTRCYVDQEYDAWCKLMYSVLQGATWSEPIPFPFIREKVNYGHPAFAANGTTLFFSSDAPEGQGGHDLYFTQLTGEAEWTDPVNLGTLINTIGQEQYPTVYRDTLYFSSDHLAGLGGLDIFKTYLDTRNQWVSPINLRAPINSGGDDFGFVVDTFALPVDNVIMQGYFTSSRGGASRNDDIYSFTLNGLKIPNRCS
jgi:peptidoglycan-associated lipoprotein